MTPLIAIQILGAVYKFKSAHEKIEDTVCAAYLDSWEDDDIIAL